MSIPIPPAPGDVLGKPIKWIAGISILEIAGGIVAVFALRASAEKHGLPISGASAEVLLGVIGLGFLLFAATFAVTAYIFVKIICDCGSKCGCGIPSPTLPAPQPPREVQKMLDDLKERLREAEAELRDAVSSGNPADISKAQGKVADLNKQIKDLGGG